jgi:glycosyltransferase involved in cell wall biosynthesis
MLRHAVSSGVPVDWTFYCTFPRRGALDEEARNLGATVIYSRHELRETAQFVRGLRKTIAVGDYDVLHCHHDLVNAVYLLAAIGLSPRRRIAHVHNADEALPVSGRMKLRALRAPMRAMCLALADRVVGISEHTLDTFLAGRARHPTRDRVHYYGVQAAAFETDGDQRRVIRQQLSISSDAKVVLFGGRMVPVKNPGFAIDVLEELIAVERGTVLVFAGSGSSEEPVRARAAELGVAEHTRFLGWRSDMPAIMNASDLFILPRLEQPLEGFGLAVIEAQLAGLPVLVSMGVTEEPILPTAAFARLPLAAGSREWALAAAQLLALPRPSRQAAHDALRGSRFDMDAALADMLSLYE